MSNTSVSIVIPFHNGSRWIERALESVKNQTVQPNEIIVVNDGSSEDEFRAIARTLAPCSINFRTTTVPVKPVAPVTSTSEFLRGEPTS